MSLFFALPEGVVELAVEIGKKVGRPTERVCLDFIIVGAAIAARRPGVYREVYDEIKNDTSCPPTHGGGQ